jgi:hypothetical protein
METNWWILRALLSRRVMKWCSGLFGIAVVYVFFFGPLQDWTQRTLQDRATSLAQRRADRIEEALRVLAEPSVQTIRLAVPQQDAGLVVRTVRAGGYLVSIRKLEGPRWRVIVRNVPSAEVAVVRGLVLQLSPKARSLPTHST